MKVPSQRHLIDYMHYRHESPESPCSPIAPRPLYQSSSMQSLQSTPPPDTPDFSLSLSPRPLVKKSLMKPLVSSPTAQFSAPQNLEHECSEDLSSPDGSLEQSQSPSSPTGFPGSSQSVLKLATTKKVTVEKKQPLACLFCRERKIACGRPDPDNEDQTCNQCARRHIHCEYPKESRRGQHKRTRRKKTHDHDVNQSVP